MIKNMDIMVIRLICSLNMTTETMVVKTNPNPAQLA